MIPLRTLTIVTAAPHHEWDGRLWSHTPYVREIDLWTHLFDRVIIVGPSERTRPPGDCIPFESDRIELRGVPPTGGDHLRDKAWQLLALPLLVWRVARAVRDADATHVRCPGNLGLLGALLVPALSTRMVAKYAGLWSGFPGEKWTVRLQRAVLRSRWWRGPVTVYGDWPDQPRHVVPFFTSVLSDAQIERARRAQRPPRRQGALNVLYVGRLSGPKNVDAVLRATGEARRRGVDIRCTIVGDGAERDHLSAIASDEGIAERVAFVGAVGLDEVLDHYERADTLVLVSQSEGWPKAIAEAMTFGLVCVGSDRGMVPQMLGEGRGLVVPPGDHAALADALCDLAAAPAAADERASVAADWGRRHSLEQLEVAIADLLTRWWGLPVGAPPRLSIVHVTDTLSAGGAERVAVNLANGMDRSRFHLGLCTTRRGGVLAAEAGDDIDRLSLDRTTRSRDPVAVLRLARYLRRAQVDIVHAHGTSLFISAAACLLAPRTRLVWHDHFGANTASGPWRRLQYRLAASRASHVITVNHELAGWATTALRVRPERVTTVPNFVVTRPATDAIVDLPGEPGGRVVCVANLRRDKDHVGFVDAMATIAEQVPGVHGLIVGSPTDAEVAARVGARIRALGLEERVSLLGRRDDVDQILAGSTVGVLTSRSEGFPLALLEYGRQGLPTVVTAVGECEEILDHGRAGRLVPPGDPGAVASAVIDLLTHPDEARALGERLRRRVDEQYGAAEVIARVERVYDAVLGTGPTGTVDP